MPLRRVSLDLTGLPPTPAEMDAFLPTNRPKPTRKWSTGCWHHPRYGERMAVRWLDAARYADTNGYQYDGERVMWRWRDWVIDAFNRNQPFDQFTLEQIAGDLLPNATLDQKIATGFNRNHRANTEDGIIPEEYAVEYVVDRVETTSTVFLGLTLGCARCHDHKYDPFTQKEFYQIFAYFNNVPELGRAMKYGNSPPVVPAPTADQQKKLDALMAKVQAERKQLADLRSENRIGTKALGIRPEVTIATALGPLSGLIPLDVTKASSKGGPHLPPVPKGSAVSLDGGPIWTSVTPAHSRLRIASRSPPGSIQTQSPDGSILSRMTDGPKGKGYGIHADHGKIHVNLTSVYADDAIRLETEETLAPKQWHHIAVTYAGSRMPKE